MTSSVRGNRNVINTVTNQYNDMYSDTAVSYPRAEKSAFARLCGRIKKRIDIDHAAQDAYYKEKYKYNEQIIDSDSERTQYNMIEYSVSERLINPRTIIIVAAVVLTLVFLILNQSKVSEYNAEIGRLESEIAEFDHKREKLSIELDEAIDISAIETYAREKGMVSVEELETRYINIPDSTVLEIGNAPDEEYSFSTFMSGVAGLFKTGIDN